MIDAQEYMEDIVDIVRLGAPTIRDRLVDALISRFVNQMP
jgi:hypothetical protein